MSIAGHANTTCGLRPDGRAVCWGENVRSPWFPRPDSVQVSDSGRRRPRRRHVQWWSAAPGGYTPTGRFRSVTAGETFWCGLRDDGSVECWDVEGTLPSGPEDLAFTSISSDYEFACALDDAGTPHCWHVQGFLKDYGPRAPPADETFTMITTGRFHACGLRMDGSAVCWGEQGSPPADLRFESIASGGWHTCGVLRDRTLACWGSNHLGQASPPGPLHDWPGRTFG